MLDDLGHGTTLQSVQTPMSVVLPFGDALGAVRFFIGVAAIKIAGWL